MDIQPDKLSRTDSPVAFSTSMFKYRAFALFWAARLFSTLAVQAESVTIGWQVYTVARHSRTVEQGSC